MPLMHSEQAIQAVTAILRDATPVAAIEVDPEARGGDEINVIAIANQQEYALIDARSTPALGAALAKSGVLGGYQAKAIHRLLSRQVGRGPNRWACIQLVEQLLLKLHVPDIVEVAHHHLRLRLGKSW